MGRMRLSLALGRDAVLRYDRERSDLTNAAAHWLEETILWTAAAALSTLDFMRAC